MIKQEDFPTLALDFRFCQKIFSKNDVWKFTINLANIFDGIVQYNNENGEYSIATVCRNMTYTDDTPYAKLVQFVQVRPSLFTSSFSVVQPTQIFVIKKSNWVGKSFFTLNSSYNLKNEHSNNIEFRWLILFFPRCLNFTMTSTSFSAMLINFGFMSCCFRAPKQLC